MKAKVLQSLSGDSLFEVYISKTIKVNFTRTSASDSIQWPYEIETDFRK